MNLLKKIRSKAEPTAATDETQKFNLDEGLLSLTGKNTDYIYDVRRLLDAAGKSGEEIDAILTEIVPRILNAQKNGTLARQLLGTPTEFASKYQPKPGDKPKKETNKDPRLMVLDSFLLLFGALSALYGVIMMLQKNNAAYGLATLILSSLTGALAMYAVYRAQSKMLEKKTEEKQSFWLRARPTVQLIGFLILWMFVTTFSAFLPPVINPLLGSPVLIVTAAIVLAARFFIKRRYNIQSSIVSRYAMDK